MHKEDWNSLDKLDAEIFPDDRLTVQDYQRMLDTQGIFALESDKNQLIGYLYVAPFGDDKGIIGRIGVAKNFQKRGLGSKLMEFALNGFEEKGTIRKIILHTQDFNINALRLYTKFGFQKVGTLWHYFVPFKSIKPKGQYRCNIIKPEEIVLLDSLYSETMPSAQIRQWLNNDRIVFTL